MWWTKACTTAKKRYRRSILQLMSLYMVVLFGSAHLVKHGASSQFALYFFSVLPAIPIMAVIWSMGRYLSDETDEYQRMLTMQAILVGTALLLAAVVVDDFLRSFAHLAGLPPFSLFVIFALGMAVTGCWQKLRDRQTADD